jgi:predicted nucleic acid-binding protein
MRLELFFGEEMFVDTNIFVYALARRHRHKRKCNDLLVQINHGDIAGFTSSTVINELFHTVLVGDVRRRYQLKKEEVIGFIKNNPQVISETKVAYKAMDDVFDSNMVILSVNFEVLKKARELSEKYDLLLSDAIHAATCKIYAISDMATNDADFDRVDFIRAWKPE